jgi:uracil-DNA glycosylase family 4
VPPAPPSTCPIPGAAGNVPASGPTSAPLCFVAEAAGHYESYKSLPLVGDAGAMFDRLLGYAGIERGACRIANAVACHPPRDFLVGAPWEQKALDHCAPALQQVLSEPHKVVVTLGATALRQVMGFTRRRGKEPARVQDFHGSPIRDPLDRFWVVPTYHPSHLQRGAQKLTKSVVFDLLVAKELAAGEWKFDKPRLVIDPPEEVFERWVERYLATEGAWLAVDIETPDKGKKTDEGELGKEDSSYEILYINLSYSTEEGITVPWVGRYKEIAKRAIEAASTLIFWNAPYDAPRLRLHGVRVDQGRLLDFMDAWHVLQSALPHGLGFVAPFYSKAGPWKHLGNLNGTYRAMDGVQTLRCAYGIARDLQAEGMWEVFERHCWAYDTYVLRPAEEVGLPLDREELGKFTEGLEKECARIEGELGAIVPEVVKPLLGPLVNRPEGESVEKQESLLVQVCQTCGAQEIGKKHRCEGTKGENPAKVVLEERLVSRYYRREPFNPASWQQVLAYIKATGGKAGRAKKTGKESSDKKTLERLLKTGDPFYRLVLDHRQANKMKGTYGTGILEKLDEQDRVHSLFTHVPSTMRLSSTNPNLQNLASHVKYASGFRRCVVAAPGCTLMSFDFAGIEALDMGWFMRDPAYIRLARLGVHAYVQSHLLAQEKLIDRPADTSWSDSSLSEFFRDIKARFKPQYEKSKRCVHGRNYGLTEWGMVDYYPEVFPRLADARRVIAIYEEVCPSLPRFQAGLIKLVHERPTRHWGGPGEHPFGYKGFFYSVIDYHRVRGAWKEFRGEDAKKLLSYPAQSTAAGTIAEAALRLFDSGSPSYIGDAYFGESPLRAIIHDELFLEVPDSEVARVYDGVMREMGAPIAQMPCPPEWGIGEALRVGVVAKMGRNWGPYREKPLLAEDGTVIEPVNLQGMKVEGLEDLAADDFYEQEEEDEVEVA